MPEEPRSHPESRTRFRTIVAGLLTVGVTAGAYAFHEHNIARQVTAQNRVVTSTLNTTRGQLKALAIRLDALNADRPAEESPAISTDHRSKAANGSERSPPDRGSALEENPRATRRAVEANQLDTPGFCEHPCGLQGSIANTHDELVRLEKKGERSYFEFDLDKSGQFQRVGPVGVRLRKANAKHDYSDLELVVNNFKVSKKHVNRDEPVIFYSADRKLGVEVVINSVGKNHVHGYVSEPRYKGGALEAIPKSSVKSLASNTSGPQTGPIAKPSPVRQRLDPPQN